MALRDQPTPAEKTSIKYWISLPDERIMTYDTIEKAESDAEEWMDEFGLKSIRIDVIEWTTGGTFQNDGSNYLRTITITRDGCTTIN